MADIGAVWVYLPFQNERGLPTRLVIFDGGLKADFTICPVAALADGVRARGLAPLYERGYRVLVDKDGMAGHLPAASLKPAASAPPTEEAFTSIVREFWFEVYHVAKYLKREDLWAVKYRDWKTKELLLTMLEWYEKTLHGSDYQTEHLGIRMKEWVGPEMWARLMGAFGHFDAADSWRALDVTVELFRRVAQETASRLGYRYPQDVDERLSRYVESLRGR
jgi:aminoglycoside 6-adenylyltransferase